MGQGVGCALGLAVGMANPRLAPLAGTVALLAGSLAIPDLRNRGTPRSTWPLRLRLAVLRTPLAGQVAVLALAAGGLCAAASARPGLGWTALLPPLLGMFAAARFEPAMRNALALPRAFAALSAAALAVRWWSAPAGAALALFVLGASCSALPAAIARGSGEMERPIASSLAWSALAAGASLGLACAAAPW